MDDRGPLDLEKQIETKDREIVKIKQDNLILAKEIDRLNEYVQEMELENVRKKK
tara:strand:- start:245 stop:406 length:162 start_codon:yes stop_codon:yes gene_type:complete